MNKPFIEVHKSGDEDNFTTIIFVFPQEGCENEIIAINKDRFVAMVKMAEDFIK